MSHGSLPYAFGEGLLEEIETELQQLRQQEMAHFEIDPTELLRKVSFFEHMGSEEFSYIAQHLVPMTVNEHELVIRQGEVGKSLFLITRGVVRVTRSERGEERELSSLFAGDVFGEMALLHGVRRSASVKAVTPCYLYELRRDALEKAMERFPHIREALREMDAKRAAEQIRPDDSGR
jgi:CRP-like cAMP-binding protein